MIVVDTSALIEIVLDRPEAARCIAAIQSEDTLLISAGTLAETLIVAGRRDIYPAVESLIESLDIEIVALDDPSARRAASAYRRWGKGVHPAALNFGDCFSYALAEQHQCRLLYVGNDFTRTDIDRAS